MVNQNAIAKMVYDLSAGKKKKQNKELYNHPQASMGKRNGSWGWWPGRGFAIFGKPPVFKKKKKYIMPVFISATPKNSCFFILGLPKTIFSTTKYPVGCDISTVVVSMNAFSKIHRQELHILTRIGYEKSL